MFGLGVEGGARPILRTLGLTVLGDGRHSPADAHDVWEQKPCFGSTVEGRQSAADAHEAWPFVVTKAKAQLMLRMFGLSVAISPTKSGSGERRSPADAYDAWVFRCDAKQSPTDVHE